MAETVDPIEYEGPAGGWGSLKGIARTEIAQKAGPGALETLKEQNKPVERRAKLTPLAG